MYRVPKSWGSLHYLDLALCQPRGNPLEKGVRSGSATIGLKGRGMIGTLRVCMALGILRQGHQNTYLHALISKHLFGALITSSQKHIDIIRIAKVAF